MEHLPCRFDHFDAVAEDLQMDSTEALLQTNSLLHESWQVVQDQVSSAGLALVVPATLSGARLAAFPGIPLAVHFSEWRQYVWCGIGLCTTCSILNA